MSIHDGHRQRMKARFRTHGLDNFDEHSVLELLLFYAVPRGDVNPLAHRLLDRFGSLAAVLDAPPEELLCVDGVGENTATLLKLVPQVGRRYEISRSAVGSILLTSAQRGEFIKPYFYAERDEVVYVICLDSKYKVIACRMVSRGSVNSTSVNSRKVVELALNCNASAVVLAHNHPSGIAIPSEEDEATTRTIRAALHAVDIRLVDHIVVADDDFVSMADNGLFRLL